MILGSMLDNRPLFLFGLSAVVVVGYVAIRILQRLLRASGRHREPADHLSCDVARPD